MRRIKKLRDLPPAARSPRWMMYFVLGLGVLAAPLLPGLEGLVSSVFLRVLCAFLFFFLGALARHAGRLEAQLVQVAELVDDLARERYGENYLEVRTTIPYLIEQLRRQPPERQGILVEALKGMTGRNYGSDPERWLEWWATNRASFAVEPPKRASIPGRTRKDKK